MMKHEIRTFAMKDGKAIREIYRESFKTAEEAYRAYTRAIADYNNLPERIRKPIMIARFNDNQMMTMQVL